MKDVLLEDMKKALEKIERLPEETDKYSSNDLLTSHAKIDNKLSKTIDYTYYLNGTLKTLASSDGDSFTYTYDDADRLIEVQRGAALGGR